MRRFRLLHAVMILTITSITYIIYSVGPTSCPMTTQEISAMIPKLHHLFATMPSPKSGDWLAEHKEPGQTFDQWQKSKPPTATGKRKILYFREMGKFDDTQRKILNLTIEEMGIYFGLETKTLPAIDIDKIPNQARRTHPTWGDSQILTTYVLDKVLKPSLPDDAAAMIALTTSDLWPGGNWNFVFGQASLSNRVGIWSIYRNGQPEKSKDDFALVLRRTLRTATHETGHMFGMLHCTAYQCNMCGSNSLPESDRYPLECCPECLAKICTATGVDPIARFKKMLAFCQTNNLKEEAELYAKELAAMGIATSNPTTTATTSQNTK